MLRPALFCFLALSACIRGDETLSAYGAADTTWVLQSIDSEPFPAHATITFPKEGEIAGTAPCNTYFGTQNAPYPWFEVKNIGSTKRACSALSAEQSYFETLSEMTISEVSETTLILSNDAKRTMIFAPQ